MWDGLVSRKRRSARLALLELRWLRVGDQVQNYLGTRVHHKCAHCPRILRVQRSEALHLSVPFARKIRHIREVEFQCELSHTIEIYHIIPPLQRAHAREESLQANRVRPLGESVFRIADDFL